MQGPNWNLYEAKRIKLKCLPSTTNHRFKVAFDSRKCFTGTISCYEKKLIRFSFEMLRKRRSRSENEFQPFGVMSVVIPWATASSRQDRKDGTDVRTNAKTAPVLLKSRLPFTAYMPPSTFHIFEIRFPWHPFKRRSSSNVSRNLCYRATRGWDPLPLNTLLISFFVIKLINTNTEHVTGKCIFL